MNKSIRHIFSFIVKHHNKLFALALFVFIVMADEFPPLG